MVLEADNHQMVFAQMLVDFLHAIAIGLSPAAAAISRLPPSPMTS